MQAWSCALLGILMLPRMIADGFINLWLSSVFFFVFCHHPLRQEFIELERGGKSHTAPTHQHTHVHHHHTPAKHPTPSHPDTQKQNYKFLSSPLFYNDWDCPMTRSFGCNVGSICMVLIVCVNCTVHIALHCRCIEYCINFFLGKN